MVSPDEIISKDGKNYFKKSDESKKVIVVTIRVNVQLKKIL